MYKILKISVKEFTDAKVHTVTIDNRRLFWVKMCDAQKRLSVENIYDLLRKEIWGTFETDNSTKEQIRKYKRRKKELDNDSNSNFRYACADIIIKIIMQCSKTQKAVEFKTKLGFNPINLIMSKQGSVTTIIMKSFPSIKMIEKYFVLGSRIDLYLPDHKLAVEVDEKGHIDRKKEKEEKRKNKIEKDLGCRFIRVNRDSEKFNIHIEIGKVYNHIN